MSIINRQVQRSKQALQEALISLIREKPYESIDIQEIADRANTARITFYRHYRTKDELLLDYLDQLYQNMQAALISYRVEDVLDLRQPPPNLPLFELLDQDQALYRTLLLGPKGGSIQQRIRHYMIEQVTRVFRSTPVLADLPIDLIANHMASCTIGNLAWWLAGESGYSADQMARITHSLGLTGALTVLGRLDLLTLPTANVSSDQNSGKPDPLTSNFSIF